MHQRKLYDAWLGVYYGPQAPKPPTGGLGVRYMSPWEGERRKHPLPTGSKFPMPEGDSWIQYVQEHERRSRKRVDHKDLSQDEHGEYTKRESESVLIARALKIVYMDQRMARKASTAKYNGGALIPLAPKATTQAEFDDLAFTVSELAYVQAHARPVTVVAWKRKMDSLGLKYSPAQLEKISSNGRIKNPFSMDIAKHRPDFPEFVKASKTEWDNIEGRNTFGPHMKIADIRAQGIKQSICPCRELCELKGSDGEVEKWKTRLVIQGSPNNVKHGEHYFDTFAPAPNCTTTRILLTLIVQLGLYLFSADISAAYLHGRMPADQQIPIRLPVHARQYDPVTGEELYRILLGSCYGLPQSSKIWSELRDKWFIDNFNSKGWTCRKSRRDPCLFIFARDKAVKRPTGKAGRYMTKITQVVPSPFHHHARATTTGGDGDFNITNHAKKDFVFLVVHTDDIDIVGTNKADINLIVQRVHDRFKVTTSDPEVMLGLKRVIAPDGKSITVTQRAYIEGMWSDFSGQVKGKRIPETPFPPNLYMTKQDPEEIDHKVTNDILKNGKYMSLVGGLLWASRMTLPQCGVGCHFLTRMLAAPTVQAYDAGIHMLCYMYGHREKGIRFSRVAKPTVVTYYDSSNRRDPKDGAKAVGGHIVFLCNGPLIWSSKKNSHTGQSSSHNEYMALAAATKATEWIRYLLMEMGLHAWVKEPTMMMGDNDAATTLCRNDIVTPANCYYDMLLYHSKQAFEQFRIDPTRIDTKLNYADGMTKAVPRQVTDAHVPAITGYVTQQVLPPRPRR